MLVPQHVFVAEPTAATPTAPRAPPLTVFSVLIVDAATILARAVAGEGYELRVNALDDRTRRLVQEWVGPMERTGRVVTPTFSAWLEAADIVARIFDRDRSWRSKLPALLNDVLIVLCARQVGATVMTYNAQDFRLIRRHKPFSLRVLTPGP
jgi:predicted nucleic acid-binding protein